MDNYYRNKIILSSSEKEISEEKSSKENKAENIGRIGNIQESNSLFSKDSNIDKTCPEKKNINYENEEKDNNKNSDLLLLFDDFNSAYKSFLPSLNNNMEDNIFLQNDYDDGVPLFTNDIRLNYNYFICDDKNREIKRKKEEKEIFIIKKVYKNEDCEEKCFPFTEGKGIIKMNYKKSVEEENGFQVNDEKNKNFQNEFYLMKFSTREYYINENGKKRKVIKQRKHNPDIIRKKLKSRFHKTLRNIININLKNVNSKQLFDFFPQCFLINLTKSLNSRCFELTYKELLSIDFTLELNKTKDYKKIDTDKNNYLRNKEVLEYLEKNPIISKKSGFDIIKNMKYKKLLKNYFISKEFEDSLNQFKNEQESQEYIQSYIYHAKNYIKYFTTNNSSENDYDIKKEEIDEEID